MISHLKQSRVAKALTDRADESISFGDAESRLSEVRVAVVLAHPYADTPSGQAAALTAAATSFKCFGSVTLVAESDTPLFKGLPIGGTIASAAAALGATVVSQIPGDSTHTVLIGQDGMDAKAAFAVRCWWNGWLAGAVPLWEDRPLGRSGNPLAGVFAGAVAVREIFATVLGRSRAGSRASIMSLWQPWLPPNLDDPGPAEVYAPTKLWFIGLGHLGQGFLWSLGLLPLEGVHAVLQDDQTVGEENEATGLLTTGDDVGLRKTRVAARWLEATGWPTTLMERRHYGDIPLLPQDPPIVVTGLDDPRPRIEIAKTGFSYLVDAGVGHGASDFESLQIRLLRQGTDPAAFWSEREQPKDVDALLKERAYTTHASASGDCGTLALAKASVAVPFVGAAVGALTIAQVIRLTCLLETAQIMHMQLGAPDMVVSGGFNSPPAADDPLAAVGSAKVKV